MTTSMTNTRAILFAAGAALLLPIAARAAKPSMIEPGRWEVTIKTELPNAVSATTTSEICITKEQAERLEPAKPKATHDCQMTGGLTGNQVKYKMKCGRKNAVTDAEFTYSGDRYEGVVTKKDDEYGEIRQTYTAKRLGECPSADE
jgi:hypothetical protein